MNRSRKIQFALGTILLWSSTTVSSLAATNINPGKNQLNTVNLPVERTPSTQLNLIPNTNLIAKPIPIYGHPEIHLDDNIFISKWEDLLKKDESTETIKKTILEFCPSLPEEVRQLLLEPCWRTLKSWSFEKPDQIRESRDFKLVRFIEILDYINKVAIQEHDKLRQQIINSQ